MIIFELFFGLTEGVLCMRLRENSVVRGRSHRLGNHTALHLVLEWTDFSFFFLCQTLRLRLSAARAVLRVQKGLTDFAAALVREITPATDQTCW